MTLEPTYQPRTVEANSYMRGTTPQLVDVTVPLRLYRIWSNLEMNDCHDMFSILIISRSQWMVLAG